jgi:hypothetical protein
MMGVEDQCPCGSPSSDASAAVGTEVMEPCTCGCCGAPEGEDRTTRQAATQLRHD